MAKGIQRRTDDAAGEHIDITLRFKKDGGIVYNAISGISSPYARAERLRQLVYAGLLAERGVSASVHVLAPTVAVEVGEEPVRQESAAHDRTATAPVATTNDASPRFAADDLMAVFGVDEN